jgi:Na+/H+ antiporter NhaD/arsenite permease-like protein
VVDEMLVAAGIILALTYAGVAFTRLPRVNIDRPSAALTGAVLMVLVGVLSFREAVESVDYNTLALLLGMMISVAVLDRTGFITFLAARVIALGTSPRRLLVAVILSTALLSAFLVNDVVVLLFTPVVIRACRLLGVNPVPYLVAEAMASNIGSTATIVGNPQNMLIGTTSGITFGRFFLHLVPVAAVSTVILITCVGLFYRRELLRGFPPGALPQGGDSRLNLRAVAPAVSIVGLAVVAFFLSPLMGVSVPMIAMGAGAALLLFGGVRPAEVIRSVDWVLLLFFGGLFVVVGGARQAGVLDLALDRVTPTADVAGIVSIHLVSAVVSQVVSNVPLTVLLIPVIQGSGGHVLWLSLAAGATLAGNATLIGAVANIIVAEGAARQGVEIRFGEFFRLGLVVAVLSLGASMLILAGQYWLGLLR